MRITCNEYEMNISIIRKLKEYFQIQKDLNIQIQREELGLIKGTYNWEQILKKVMIY